MGSDRSRSYQLSTLGLVNPALVFEFRGIRIAKSIRENHGARSLKALPFTIHPLAQFSERLKKEKSTRDLYQFKNINNPQVKPVYRALLREPRQPWERSQGANYSDVNHIKLKPEVGFVGDSHPAGRSSQLTYGDYKISTTLRHSGLWVAYFGRSDGSLIGNASGRRAVLETGSFTAEVLAIAAAQIEIDGLVELVRRPNTVKTK